MPRDNLRTEDACSAVEPASYGGQAVLEGVMMRNRQRVAVAVRRPDGGIEVKTEPVGSFYRSRWARLPLIRGLLTLWDSLGIGMRALMFSADVAAGEEVDISGPAMWGTVAFSLLLGVGLFFALPALIASLLDRFITGVWLSNLIEGGVRLAIFIGYLVAISRIPDIRRVFAYHGAEHKVINAYEAGEPLDVEHVRPYDTAHARCGTGFLLIVVIVSIFIFGFLGKQAIVMRLLTRIVLVPLIAAVSYEVVRLASRHRRNIVARIVMAPSLQLQSLTAKKPTDDMLEVALVALKHVQQIPMPLPENIEPEEAKGALAS